MEPKITSQEILIPTESQFYSRYLTVEEGRDISFATHKEILTNACWNGMLETAIPEILPQLSLININEGNRFLDLRFSSYGQHVEGEFSINPYLFLLTERKN